MASTVGAARRKFLSDRARMEDTSNGKHTECKTQGIKNNQHEMAEGEPDARNEHECSVAAKIKIDTQNQSDARSEAECSQRLK